MPVVKVSPQNILCAISAFASLTLTNAYPSFANGNEPSSSKSKSSSFASEILINRDDDNAGISVSVQVLPGSLAYVSLPPVEGNVNSFLKDYYINGLSDSSDEDGEVDDDDSYGYDEFRDCPEAERGMLVTSAEITTDTEGVRCFLLYPDNPFPDSFLSPSFDTSSPQSSSGDFAPSIEDEENSGSWSESEDTRHLSRFTSPIFTPDSLFDYSEQSPPSPLSSLPSPSSSSPPAPHTEAYHPRSDALLCYIHPHPSPSSYPLNYPDRAVYMPIAVLLLEYTHPDRSPDQARAQHPFQDWHGDAGSQDEHDHSHGRDSHGGGGLDLLMLDLHENGSARHVFGTTGLDRGLGEVRGIERAVVLEQGEGGDAYHDRKVVCRFETDGHDHDEYHENDEHDEYDGENESGGVGSGLAPSSFGLDEALQTPIHGATAVVCEYANE